MWDEERQKMVAFSWNDHCALGSRDLAGDVAMGQSRTIHWSGRGIQPTLLGQPFRPRHSILLRKQIAVNVLQLIEI
jgi:hypothetical protein